MDGEERRAAAVARLKARRDFMRGLLVYTLVNAALVVIWFVQDERGFFWPIWPIAGWGLAVAMQWWAAYRQRPISEADIEQELGRMGIPGQDGMG